MRARIIAGWRQLWRKALLAVGGIVVLLLLVMPWACSREDLGLMEMAVYGVIDRARMEHDQGRAHEDDPAGSPDAFPRGTSDQGDATWEHGQDRPIEALEGSSSQER